MSDFAKKQAERIRGMERQQAEANERANTESIASAEREALTRKLGPELWTVFRDLIASKCQDVNKELGKEYYRVHDEMPNKLHVIRLNPVANLHLEFFPEANRIHYDSGPCVGDYLVGLRESNGQAVLADAYHHTFNSEVEAERMLVECLAKA
jgi:hypothetical protein